MIDNSVLDDVLDLGRTSNVFERIAIEDDEIGQLTGDKGPKWAT